MLRRHSPGTTVGFCAGLLALRAVVEQDPRAARSLMSRAHEPVARVRPKSNSGGLQ